MSAIKPTKGSLKQTQLDQLSFFSEPPSPTPDIPLIPSGNATKYQKGRLYRLDADELFPDNAQPRQYFDEESLQELAASILVHGILQPVIFKRESDGRLQIMAGGRRLAAARLAGLKTIPAICSDGDAAEIALVENLVRKDLTSIEEAEAIERLKDRHGYTLAKLSEILGKSVSTLSEIISLTRLPELIRAECRGDSSIARSILVEIAKCPSEEEMLSLYIRYRRDGLSRAILRKKDPGENQQRKGFTRLFRSFSRQLTAIDMTGLAERERSKVRKELEGLRGIIDERLANLDN